MIKHTFLASLLFGILLFSQAHAHNKVAVVPLGGDTFQLTTETAELFSWYGDIAQANANVLMVTVPENKILVITKVILPTVNGDSSSFGLYENDTIKTHLRGRDDVTSIQEVSLGSGIPFQSGQNVNIRRLGVRGGHFVTVIGHFSAAP